MFPYFIPRCGVGVILCLIRQILNNNSIQIWYFSFCAISIWWSNKAPMCASLPIILIDRGRVDRVATVPVGQWRPKPRWPDLISSITHHHYKTAAPHTCSVPTAKNQSISAKGENVTANSVWPNNKYFIKIWRDLTIQYIIEYRKTQWNSAKRNNTWHVFFSFLVFSRSLEEKQKHVGLILSCCSVRKLMAQLKWGNELGTLFRQYKIKK